MLATGLVESGSRRTSIAEIRERSERAAAGFGSAPTEGGTIAILLRNDFAFIEASLAAGWAGKYSVPINWHLSPEEVNHILRDSGATHLVIHSDLLDRYQDAIPPSTRILYVQTPPEILAAYRIQPGAGGVIGEVVEWTEWLNRYEPLSVRHTSPRGSMFYTSGTTGRPKGVRREPPRPEHARVYAELRAEWFGHRPGMRTAMIGPMYHSVQSSYALAAVNSNGGVALLPRFDAEEVLRLIERCKLTHLHLVPTMMTRLLQLPETVRKSYDLSSLEFVIHGAAPCPPHVKRRLIEWWGPIIHEYYGTTEAGMVSRSNSVEWLERPGTVGRAWPGREIRIYGENGIVLPPMSTGEIYMSLGTVPDFTYHNADDLRCAVSRDGLITSGDIGYLDHDGYLFLCARSLDLIISGGVNIYPAEVEAAFALHPAVADSAVFGIPDADYGEAPAAVVQLRDGMTTTPESLREFLQLKIAKYKVPRRIELRDTLPRDDSGKMFKRLLREPYWSNARRGI